MMEMIVVAGKSKTDICWIRHCLRDQGFDSIPCKSIEQMVDEMKILPTCGVSVPLVVIESKILNEVNDEMIAILSDFALDVPFVLVNESEIPADLVEIFERICECRTKFEREQNPLLADVLTESVVELSGLTGE